MAKWLKKGDVVRLKVPLIGGWKGLCTVLEDQSGFGPDTTILISPHDGKTTPENAWERRATCVRHELVVPRPSSLR